MEKMRSNKVRFLTENRRNKTLNREQKERKREKPKIKPENIAQVQEPKKEERR